MNIQVAITINDAIQLARTATIESEKRLINLCVYTNSSVKEKQDIELNDICYIANSPTGGEHGEDVFLDFVVENNLEFLFSGDILIDTVQNALWQKPDATNTELLDAITHYLSTDGFIDFSVDYSIGKYYIVVIPKTKIEDMRSFIDLFGEKRLRNYQLFIYKSGTVLLTTDVKSDYRPFADLASGRYFFALNVCIDETKWTHLLYENQLFASPAPCIVSGQEKKKNPKRRIAPIPQAIQAAFPHTDIDIIKNYICDKKNETELISRDGRFYVQENDKYPIGDGRQGFDFIRYLGFAIAM